MAFDEFDESHFQAIKAEVKRHQDDADTSKLSHWYAAARYERWHKIFIGLPATIFSLILTWILSSEVKNFLTTTATGDLKVIASGLPVIISLLVSILTGLGAFLNFNELASRHRIAAESLNALSRECMNFLTDFPNAHHCDKAVQTAQSYRRRLNDINRDSPQIPEWAYEGGKKKKEKGEASYSSDVVEK